MLIVISLIVFGMISLAPGGPLAALEENPNITSEDVARLEKQLGLDQPVYVRYIRWLSLIHISEPTRPY